MMKANFFSRIGWPQRWAVACSMIVSSGSLASAQQIPALMGIQRVAERHGTQFIQKIVEMKGYKGQSQPEEWRVIVYDPASEYLLREFWIGDRRATNEGAYDDYYPKRQPEGFISLDRLKIDSVAAFNVLNKEAAAAKIGFDSIDYHLRCREFSDEPIWTLTAKDDSGHQVARIDLSAQTGRVLRTVWSYRIGRKVPMIKDSALLGRPQPIELVEDPEPVPRALPDGELINPAARREPLVPAPGDEQIDPGTEVPDVTPIDSESQPVPAEP